MESCAAIERELEKVTEKFGEGLTDTIARIDEQLSCLKDLEARLLLHPDEVVSPNEASRIMEVINVIRNSVSTTVSNHRKQHSSVSKVGKAIDRKLIPDFMPIPFFGHTTDRKILFQAICQHLYREGQLKIGEALREESGITMNPKVHASLSELHRILTTLKSRDLEPALKWASEVSYELREQGSTLEFKLNRLAFLCLVEEGRQSEAIEYAKMKLSKFAKRHPKDIQKLMGSLVFSGRLMNSPYAKLFEKELWEDAAVSFTRDSCTWLGLPEQSPLDVSFAAGCRTIPQLLKICRAVQTRQIPNILNSGRQELPIEVDLQTNFIFHSGFACPILRRRTFCDTNPPMRLTCGHVICRDALHKLVVRKRVKCPYCPEEQSPEDARQITF